MHVMSEVSFIFKFCADLRSMTLNTLGFNGLFELAYYFYTRYLLDSQLNG
jgi:hypothetical protein